MDIVTSPRIIKEQEVLHERESQKDFETIA